MDRESREVSLATLGGGAAEELFQVELAKVLSNIADPNTESQTPREILLKVRIKPNKDRSFGLLRIVCYSKLVQINPHECHVFMGLDEGSVRAFEEEVRQPSLPGIEGKVIPMGGRK